MALVNQLADMGFPVEACKKAVFNTKTDDVEDAMNWVMAHMDDSGKRCHELGDGPYG